MFVPRWQCYECKSHVGYTKSMNVCTVCGSFDISLVAMRRVITKTPPWWNLLGLDKGHWVNRAGEEQGEL